MSEGSPLNRRTFLSGATIAAAALALGQSSPAAAAGQPASASGTSSGETVSGVDLHWLDGKPDATTGTAWGVPWPQGKVAADTGFALQDQGGDQVPVQSWPLAYWPDGSLKWTGHAVSSSAVAEGFHLAPGTPAAPKQPVTAKRNGDEIQLGNGIVDIRLARSGPVAIRSITRGGRTKAHDGRLVLMLQNKPDDTKNPRHTSWSGVVEKAEIEQSGPVRAVVKLTGRYRQDSSSRHGIGGRAILPWTMRVYLGAEDESLRVMHQFVWDGDASADFIRGLGLQLAVPMRDQFYDRHVRFAGPDKGVWGEAVVGLTGLRRDPGAAVRAAQIAGTATPPVAQWESTVQAGWKDLPQWADFSLVQHSAAQCAVWKRTSSEAAFLKHAGFADHAPGFGYVGGVSGGLGVGLRDFWQQFPRALDIRDANTDTATVTLWSWSPHAEAMDLRSYDAASHGLDLAYEDDRYGFGMSTGMARSTDMQLWALDATPSRERVAVLAAALDRPQLVATPETYHGINVFGRWSLPNRSTPGRTRLEDSIASSVSFYAEQVKQRQWYGFWDYGDIMHTYDSDRHTWRYDVGGFAWDNAELGSDAALWYQFLRTGDPQTFHLARAMTRHVTETDTIHTGPFAGLGSRHDVQHFADGGKEPRVSEAYTKRFMYYLTADEFIGDAMRVPLQLDSTLLKYPPLRDYLAPPAGVPTVIRLGPDWYALVSNWLTEWERTGDTKWRDRIVTGMRDIAQLPAGLFTGQQGGAVGYDPATGHISDLKLGGDWGKVNLTMVFCGEQILWETISLIEVPEFRAKLVEFCRYVQAPASELTDHYGFKFSTGAPGVFYSRMTAWAGEQTKEPAVQQRGWDAFTKDGGGTSWPAPVHVNGTAAFSKVDELPQAGFSTNGIAQNNLAIIALLAVAPDQAP
ncbi:twin-arginine translocation signal domain-containing protein [Streptomyces sp. NBC_00464]|uniref:exo-rhamnogalacturonan lyase family protein n=1 Tax=Streptomyces sp. NBC_00464 TaxID=2975751 RepID=UPI002E16CBA7